MICGADNWVEIKDFGKAKRGWFDRFLKLPNGIPSHDTFGRVFAMLDPDRFAVCFTQWVKSVSGWSRVRQDDCKVSPHSGICPQPVIPTFAGIHGSNPRFCGGEPYGKTSFSVYIRPREEKT